MVSLLPSQTQCTATAPAVHCNRSRSALHPSLQCTASVHANTYNRPCKALPVWDNRFALLFPQSNAYSQIEVEVGGLLLIDSRNAGIVLEIVTDAWLCIDCQGGCQMVLDTGREVD